MPIGEGGVVQGAVTWSRKLSRTHDTAVGYPVTPLRANYERARSLDLSGQIRECIDLLENPDLIAEDVLASFFQIEESFGRGNLNPDVLRLAYDRQRAEQEEPEWFYGSRDLSVLGDSCSFTCLTSNVEPLPGSPKTDPTTGLDYVGLTCDVRSAPVLGVVQSEQDATAYPLFLRALACLAETSPFEQRMRMKSQCFRGAFSNDARFDLHLVVWEFCEGEERTPICQLTRDLSELVKNVLASHERFPSFLADIVCLRMNPERFDGRMRFDWRV